MPKQHGASTSDQPFPTGILAMALEQANPALQKTMLGENLYPLVEKLEPKKAAKITGMLLEMPPDLVLHLIQSPRLLKSKVAEAMLVLRSVADQQQQITGHGGAIAN